MKFKDIKTGDTVYTETSVRHGWNLQEDFFTPKKVTRVTKTKFVLDDGSEWKKDGNGLKNHKYRRAYFFGEKTNCFKPRIVKDETEQMELFKVKLHSAQKLANLMRMHSNISVKTLIEKDSVLLRGAIKSIEKLVESKD